MKKFLILFFLLIAISNKSYALGTFSSVDYFFKHRDIRYQVLAIDGYSHTFQWVAGVAASDLSRELENEEKSNQLRSLVDRFTGSWLVLEGLNRSIKYFDKEVYVPFYRSLLPFQTMTSSWSEARSRATSVLYDNISGSFNRNYKSAEYYYQEAIDAGRKILEEGGMVEEAAKAISVRAYEMVSFLQDEIYLRVYETPFRTVHNNFEKQDVVDALLKVMENENYKMILPEFRDYYEESIKSLNL